MRIEIDFSKDKTELLATTMGSTESLTYSCKIGVLQEGLGGFFSMLKVSEGLSSDDKDLAAALVYLVNEVIQKQRTDLIKCSIKLDDTLLGRIKETEAYAYLFPFLRNIQEPFEGLKIVYDSTGPHEKDLKFGDFLEPFEGLKIVYDSTGPHEKDLKFGDFLERKEIKLETVEELNFALINRSDVVVKLFTSSMLDEIYRLWASAFDRRHYITARLKRSGWLNVNLHAGESERPTASFQRYAAALVLGQERFSEVERFVATPVNRPPDAYEVRRLRLFVDVSSG